MRAIRAIVPAVLLVGALLTSGVAWGAITNATGTNVQQGNNRATTNQAGKGKTGPAVGGQVTGVVSSGRTSVDAKNTSSNSDVTSGDVRGTNSASSFVGQNTGPSASVGATTADITNSTSFSNLLEGNNTLTTTQTVDYSTGDGVAGEVIGVVTAAGGSASIVAANETKDSSVQTGDVTGSGNDLAAFVGQESSGCASIALAGTLSCTSGPAVTADITNSSANANIQEGDNRTTARQASTATTGDGVAGQVIGAVSAGATSIDARNSSTNVDITTGDATSNNDLASFTGQNASDCLASSSAIPGPATSTCASGPVVTADITGSGGSANIQQGRNTATFSQTAAAATGDGVGGQVVGAVTSAGGSSSIVAANTSTDVTISTGDAKAANDQSSFVGQNTNTCMAFASATAATATAACTAGPVITADISDTGGVANVQEGDNRTTASQMATSTTGDGVGGQVIGAVSAGATSIDARNTSTGVDIATGDATSNNRHADFVGQDLSQCGVVALATGTGVASSTCAAGPVITADISGVVNAANVQEGNNRLTSNQAATATSGDGVGGEVIGAVTSAGGSASIVAANTSNNVDVTTGNADATNAGASFVGQEAADCSDVFANAGTLSATAGVTCTAAPALTADITNVAATNTAGNVQEGDNRLTSGQTATAGTGDGVAGQVLGVVSAGAASLDATNRSDDSSVTTGDARASNASVAFVGQNVNVCFQSGPPECTTSPTFGAADVSLVNAFNVQEGDNRKTLGQNADASSGDAVAGQVSGVVTSAGGSASAVLANTSTGIDGTSGDSRFDNSDTEFVGLNVVTSGPLSL